jgi:hypothetical protein
MKPKELPLTPSVDVSGGAPWSGSELDPLDLPSANTLLNFSNDGEGYSQVLKSAHLNILWRSKIYPLIHSLNSTI